MHVCAYTHRAHAQVRECTQTHTCACKHRHDVQAHAHVNTRVHRHAHTIKDMCALKLAGQLERASPELAAASYVTPLFHLIVLGLL